CPAVTSAPRSTKVSVTLPAPSEATCELRLAASVPVSVMNCGTACSLTSAVSTLIPASACRCAASACDRFSPQPAAASAATRRTEIVTLRIVEPPFRRLNLQRSGQTRDVRKSREFRQLTLSGRSVRSDSGSDRCPERTPVRYCAKGPTPYTYEAARCW